MYLTEVVKVVFVMNPSIFGSQAVGFVGNVLHIQTHTVVELAFEELRREVHTERETGDRPTHTHTKIEAQMKP